MKKISTDHALSISALITAVVAVWIAVVEQQSNREYQRLSVEPYLELANSNRNTYERLLTNSGLGPARIQSVDVSIDGVAIRDWSQAIKVLTNVGATSINISDLWQGRQIKAGEQVVLLQLSEKPAALEFHRNVGKLNMKVCYCSIYKDCWIKQSGEVPKAVEQCPADWGSSFPL